MRNSHVERTRRALWVMYTRLTSTHLHKSYLLTLIITLLPLFILHILALHNTTTALSKLSLLLSSAPSSNSLVPTVTEQNGQGILRLCNVGQSDCQTVTSVAPIATPTQTTPQQVGAGGGGTSTAIRATSVPVIAGVSPTSSFAPDVAIQPGGARLATGTPPSAPSLSTSSSPLAPPASPTDGVLIADPPQPTTANPNPPANPPIVTDTPSSTSSTSTRVVIADAPATTSENSNSNSGQGNGNDDNNNKGQGNGNDDNANGQGNGSGQATTTESTLPPLVTPLNPVLDPVLSTTSPESTTSSEITSSQVASTTSETTGESITSTTSVENSAETETESSAEPSITSQSTTTTSQSTTTTSTSPTFVASTSPSISTASTSTTSTDITPTEPQTTATSTSSEKEGASASGRDVSANEITPSTTTRPEPESKGGRSTTTSSPTSTSSTLSVVQDTTSSSAEGTTSSAVEEPISSSVRETIDEGPKTKGENSSSSNSVKESSSTSKPIPESTESSEARVTSTKEKDVAEPTISATSDISNISRRDTRELHNAPSHFLPFHSRHLSALPLHALSSRAFSATPITNSTTGALSGIDVTDVNDTGGNEVTRLDVVCAIAMAFPRDQLRQVWMENLTIAAFYLCMLGVGIVAILNESIPHLLTISLSAIISLLWTGTQLVRTHYVHDQFDAFITRGACGGIDVLPAYWAQRTRLELPILIFNAIALLFLGILGFQLLKRFYKQEGSGRGMERYVYKLVIVLRCSILLGGFFMLGSLGIWVRLLFTNAGVVGTIGVDVLKALGILSLIFVLPWAILGWLALNGASPTTTTASTTKGNQTTGWWGKRTQMGLFCLLDVLFLGGWIATFASDVYRSVFLAWTFFAALSIAGFFVLMGALGVGVVCWMRFARDLDDWDDEKQSTSVMSRPFSIASNDPFGVHVNTHSRSLSAHSHSQSQSRHSPSNSRGRGVIDALTGGRITTPAANPPPAALHYNYSNTAEKAWEPFNKPEDVRQSVFTSSDGRQSTAFSYGLRSPVPPMPTRNGNGGEGYGRRITQM